MGARLFSPTHVVAIDKADTRLEAAKQFGADVVVNNGREDPAAVIAELTGGLGADVDDRSSRRPGHVRARREPRPPRWPRCQHRSPRRSPRRCTSKTLWIKDVTITTGLVDTYSTPTLLKLITGQQVDAGRFVTHHFTLDEFVEAYDVFGRAAETGALKVVLTRD